MIYITKTCPCNIQGFFSPVKIENFMRKILIFFLIFAQNIDCGYTLELPRRGGSNEYPQSMFWSKNKKNRYTPAYPSFTVQKWGLRGYSLHGHVFLMSLPVKARYLFLYEISFFGKGERKLKLKVIIYLWHLPRSLTFYKLLRTH